MSADSTAATSARATSQTAAAAMAIAAAHLARATAAMPTRPSPPAAPTSRGRELGVLLCSKDRAWQLDQLLNSLHQAQAALPTAERAPMRVVVIYTYSTPAHGESYRRIESRQRQQWAHLEFLDEAAPPTHAAIAGARTSECEAEAPFTCHLMSALHRWQAEGDVSAILFGVDDMLFYRDDIPFRRLISLMDEHPASVAEANSSSAAAGSASDDILAVHLVLHPSVTFCHPANKTTRKPPLLPIQQCHAAPSASSSAQQTNQSGSLSLLKWMRFLGDCDWNYPFSLAGSIYRLDDILPLLASAIRAHGPLAINHPNRLEVVGNRVMERGSGDAGGGGGSAEASQESSGGEQSKSTDVPLSSRRMMSCCLSHPVMSVITVNRVQEIYKNRIYQAKEESPPAAAAGESSSAVAPPSASVPIDLSANALLQLSLDRPTLAFDLAQYRAAAIAGKFTSVHIGDFFTSESNDPAADAATATTLSATQ